MLTREKQGLGRLGGEREAAQHDWAGRLHPAVVKGALEEGISNVSTGKAVVTLPEVGDEKATAALLASIVVPTAPPPGVPVKPKVAIAPKKILEKAAGLILPVGVGLLFALLKR